MRHGLNKNKGAPDRSSPVACLRTCNLHLNHAAAPMHLLRLSQRRAPPRSMRLFFLGRVRAAQLGRFFYGLALAIARLGDGHP